MRIGPASVADMTAASTPGDASPTTLPGGLALATASIRDLQIGLEAGDFTSVDLVAAYLARIEAVDRHGPRLGAVRVLAEDALARAQECDEARAAGSDAGPLLGIPVLVKDNIDVAGLPTTAGSMAMAHCFPGADAPLVTSLRAAGAVILGKTNLTEMANFMTWGMPSGYSSLGGQVLNPYDLSQTPSGSSAGAAAACAAALAAATVGTETSGSILSPAGACSVVGIKPTVGLIDREGVVPIAASQDTPGPMARTVYDAAALLSALCTGASHAVDYVAGLSTSALRGTRLGYVSSTDETYAVALQVLRNRGATLIEVAAPLESEQPEILASEFRRDLDAYLAGLPHDAPVHSLAEIIAHNLEHPGRTLKFGQTLLTDSQAVDLSDPVTLAAYETARDTGQAESRQHIDDVLNDQDVEAIVSNGETTAIGARAGYPTLTLPAGYDPSNRRPVPIMFLGTAWSEQRLIALASDYEVAAGVWRSPEEINPTVHAGTPLASYS